MLLNKTPKHAKFGGERVKNADISAIENLCSPENVGHVHQNFFKGLLLHKTRNQPKFRQNRLKNAEISTIKNLCSRKNGPRTCFFGHGQKHDYMYLSRA